MSKSKSPAKSPNAKGSILQATNKILSAQGHALAADGHRLAKPSHSPSKQHDSIQLQLVVNEPRTLLMNTDESIRFSFRYGLLGDGRQFCLRVEPKNTQVCVILYIDGSRKQKYHISRSQGILIREKVWQRASFLVQATSLEKISAITVQMTTIKINFKFNVKVVPDQKKVIAAQLDQFIRNNSSKQKIEEIRRRRKSSSLKTSQSQALRSTQSIMQSQIHLSSTQSIFLSSSNLPQPGVENVKMYRTRSAQLSRDIHHFEDRKNKIKNHINKMKPEKVEAIDQVCRRYQQNRVETVISISKLVYATIFVRRFNEVIAYFSRKNISKIQVHILCKKFMRNLQDSIRNKTSIRIRNKKYFSLHLKLAHRFLHNRAKISAVKIAAESIVTYSFKQSIPAAFELSEKYIAVCRKLQEKARCNRQKVRVRVEWLIVEALGNRFQSRAEIDRAVGKFIKCCYSRGVSVRRGRKELQSAIPGIVAEVYSERAQQLRKLISIEKVNLK